MDVPDTNHLSRFDRFCFDRRGGGLFREDDQGNLSPVALGSRALDVLGLLVSRPGDLVSKNEIMRVVWQGTVVEEKNLTVQISTLRRVLDEGGSGESCIQTVAGRGYRFIRQVTHLQDAQLVSIPAPETEPGVLLPASNRKRHRLWLTAGLSGVAVGAIAAAGIVWMLHANSTLPRAAVAAPVAPRAAAYSPQDRRLSLIVLPFENSGDDPAEDIAAGLTRDVTDRFAQDLLVPLVPAATAAAYRRKTLDLRAIGREHDVHFALTGNARRQNGRLILAATLYDISNVQSVWSQRFDRPDDPEEWTAIIRIITGNVDQARKNAEVARAMREHPGNLDKRDLMFAQDATVLSSPVKENLLKRIALVERALALDPDYPWALQARARLLAGLVNTGYSTDPTADLAHARAAVDRALRLEPASAHTFRAQATVLRAQGDLSGAAALLRKVIELEPMWGFRYFELGLIQMAQGQHKQALENYRTARRLAMPTDSVNVIDAHMALGLLANDRFPEAIDQAHLAIQEFPSGSGRGAELPWLALIAAQSADGREAEARADLRAFLSTERTWHSLAEIKKILSLAGNPRLLDGLRHAGMPEE